MTNIDYSHQTDIFDPRKFSWPIHVIGLGGIGSSLLLPLVKLGLQGDLHLWDDDEVEPHNIPCQLCYRPSDVGVAKAEAAKAFLERMEAQVKIHPHVSKVDEDTALEGVVISGVDSMASRKAIWSAVQWNTAVPFYMDGRIGGEEFNLLTLSPTDPDDIEWYEAEELFDDNEAAPLPCAARTVIHPPLALSGHIVAQLTLFARNLPTMRGINLHMKTTQTLTQEKQSHEQ